MSMTILILMMLIALISMISFSYSVIFPIIICLVAVGLVIIKIFVLKKLPKIVSGIIMWVGVILCMCMLWLMKTTDISYKFSDYTEAIMKAEELMYTDMDAAEDFLKEIDEVFGERDSVFGLHATMALYKDDIDEAYQYMSRYSDKNSMEYFRKLEAIYVFDSSNDNTSNLYDLYDKAAEKYPAWGYMQRMKGVCEFEKENYNKAKYYLMSALENDSNDVVAYFYLGAACCETGNYEDSVGYFEQALLLGVNDEMQSWIAWYLERMA